MNKQEVKDWFINCGLEFETSLSGKQSASVPVDKYDLDILKDSGGIYTDGVLDPVETEKSNKKNRRHVAHYDPFIREWDICDYRRPGEKPKIMGQRDISI